MNEDACAAADGKSGCIFTHLLRLSANMVYLSPKNFEFCSFECEYIMYTVCKARAWQQWHYIRRLAKKRMARADSAWLTCLLRAQISYALRPRVFRYVSLRMHALVLESIQFHFCSRGKRSVLVQPRTPACSEQYGSTRPQVCNDCAPGISFLNPQAPSSDTAAVSEAGRTAEY